MLCNPTPRTMAQAVRRWDLAKLGSVVVNAPTDDPMDDVMRVRMARRTSGARGGRFVNHREYFVTVRDYHAACRLYGREFPDHPMMPVIAVSSRTNQVV